VLAGIVAGVWLLWKYGLDLMAAAAVALTPQTVVGLIDAGVLKSVDFAVAEPSTLTDTERARIEAIFNRLIDDLPADEAGQFQFHLVYREMEGLGPNAVALPNGTVIVTDEIVRLFPDDDDVLAGVLGHEIGHVIEKHGLRQLYRSISFSVLVALLLGDTGPIVEDVALEGSVVLSLSYSRKHESAADRFGVWLAKRAGYDPQGLIDFFDYVGEKYGNDASFLSSHPAPSDRIEEIRRLMAE
jgi:predicted Zn-dependent protease